MTRFNYDSIFSLFPKCEELMSAVSINEEHLSTWEDNCNNFKKKFQNISNPYALDICLFNLIDGKHHLFIKEFYMKLIELAFESTYFDTYFYNIKEHNISDEFDIVKDLYDINIEIDNIKKSDSTKCNNNICMCAKNCEQIYSQLKYECEKKYDSGLHTTLENIRNKLIQVNSIKDCTINLPDILPFIQRRTLLVSTSISIFTILLILCAVFFINKFTPYRSHLQVSVKRIIHVFKNTNEVWDIMQSFEAYYNNSGDRRYNVLYNFA
ncbi:variable surface protein [Plasmodium gonderi]|uniref:Variable surface protein n=1 Tax=Plasmodium gonderi TaxID=77519 RepID=A0A1Y1JUG1_PLAGO|nr:variable surface protein [Plasmodium gonderi]GAW84392.1 variable surface protein [Plasmodium gonderi]